MPILKTYRVFISHAWKYNDDYYRLEEMLQKAPNFSFANYSVPKHDPLVNPEQPAGKRKLQGMLDNQISPVHIVLILSGMYAAYSEWIQYEIDKASSLHKPIIGITPWGQGRTPNSVTSRVKVMVGWNTSTIIEAIRTYSLNS